MHSIEKTVLPGGLTSLRVRGCWSKEIESAIEQINFDRLEIGAGLIGGFSNFQQFSKKIRWLWNSAIRESIGLENLTEIRRIDCFDVVPEPPFDYRLLPKLKYFSCNNAEKIPAKYLNIPSLECLDVEYLKVTDLSCFFQAKALRALRLSNAALRSAQGIENLSSLCELRLLKCRSLKDITHLRFVDNLEILELEGVPNISSVEPIYGLKKLKKLFVDSRNAKQVNFDWLENIPELECASILIETDNIDWTVFAKHPRLYDVCFFAKKGFVCESSEVVIKKLSSYGKCVKSFKQFPKSEFPAFSIEFFPDSNIKNPAPQYFFRNKLQFLGSAPD
jgi:hypothetical protein